MHFAYFLPTGVVDALTSGLITKVLNAETSSTFSIKPLKQLHAQIITTGLHLHQQNYIAVKLISLTDDIPYSRAIFNATTASTNPNVYLYTTIIATYSRRPSTAAEAILLYQTMLRHSGVELKPNHFTLSSLLKACSFLNPVCGRQMHAHVVRMGFGCFPYVETALMDMYAKVGCVESARIVFDEMPDRGVVACNAMIVECGKSGDVEGARRVFDEMTERDLVSWNGMIGGYTNHGDMAEALKLFEEMPEKDVTSWNEMIGGYSRNREWDKAMGVFYEMCLKQFKPNQVTYAVVFSVCGHIGYFEMAKRVHRQMKSDHSCVEMNTHVFNSLIDMYSKCGSVDDSYRLFCKISFKDIVSYNTMILGFSNHGRAQDALKLFKELLENDLQPDQITFLGVLVACNHAGQLEMGRNYFISMRKDYGLEPSVDHYACMVDLLGRAGLVEDAYDLVKTMKVEPHAGVWGALLTACRTYGNVEIGEVAAEKLFKMEPQNRSNYVLLSNIYASADMWDDVAKVRSRMRQSEVEKTTGVSCIEVDGTVSKFFNADATLLQGEDINAELGHLCLNFVLPIQFDLNFHELS